MTHSTEPLEAARRRSKWRLDWPQLTGWMLSICLIIYIFYSTIIFASVHEELSIAATIRPHVITLAPIPTAPSPMIEDEVHTVPTSDAPPSFFAPWDTFESLFFFGDSYTSTVFDFNGAQPSPSEPFGNRDGAQRNWPLYLITTHNASLLLAYNFAAGGSTVDRKLSRPFLLGLDFREEAHNFLEHYGPDAEEPKASWNASTSLFISWFGVNDIFMPRARGEDHGPDISALSASYRESMSQLYAAGARNFLVLTVPPAYHSVDYDVEDRLDIAGDTAAFNARIFEMRSALAAEWPDARLAVFDAHSFWARVIEAPSDFEETKDVLDAESICFHPGKITDGYVSCDDGSHLREHIWMPLHGSFVIHNATAAQVVKDCFAPDGKQGYCF